MSSQSLDKTILEALEKKGSVQTLELAKELGKDHQVIVGSVKSIQCLGDVCCTCCTLYMLYVVFCMLYVVCCMLYVVCCVLYVVCRMSYVVCCMLYMFLG